MTNRVKLRKSALDYFRKLARESPLEIQAYLIGEVVHPNLTVVDSLAYTTKYGVQTRDQVGWYRSDYEAVRKQAEEHGRRIVGSIHSHPDWDAVVSPSDYEACIAEGHRVCGIVSTKGRSTRARFWVMDCALPCEVMYVKKKATSKCAEPSFEGREIESESGITSSSAGDVLRYRD